MQTEVLNYIEFLSERYPKTNSNPIEPRAKRGELGSLKGSRSKQYRSTLRILRPIQRHLFLIIIVIRSIETLSPKFFFD